MTVDWPIGIHVWHQLGDNILNGILSYTMQCTL